jgi:hypothetical protein
MKQATGDRDEQEFGIIHNHGEIDVKEYVVDPAAS